MIVEFNLNDLAFMAGSLVICLTPILAAVWFFAAFEIRRRGK